MSDNVVDLFPKKRVPVHTPFTTRSRFFQFPADTRFELSNDGEVVISLAPTASEKLKQQWPTILRRLALKLKFKRLQYMLQGVGGDVDQPAIPDVLRVKLKSIVELVDA